MLAIVHNAACTWLARNRPADIVAVDDLEAVDAPLPSPPARAQPDRDARPRPADAAPRRDNIDGCNVVTWTARGVEYRAVSDLNPTELGEFADRVHAAG